MKIQKIPTSNMSRQEWLNYRLTGIGASEVGTVMGLNPYMSSIELFYKKIGITPQTDIDNSAMFWGRELEAQICDKWQYWAGDEESMIENFKNEKIVRKCARVNAYIRNDEHPHLFCSLDRKIISTTNAGEESALEAKTISGYAANMWEAGIPPQYVVQLQTQLLICGYNMGELALLIDGRNMNVIPFARHDDIIKGIIAKTAQFWERCAKGQLMVKQLRDAERDMNQSLIDFYNNEIHKLEPEPDGSEAYENYLSDRFKGNASTRDGEMIEFNLGKEHLEINDQIKLLEEKARERTNKIKAFMGNVEVLDFMALGKITWKPNKSGTRVFRNSLKIEKGEIGS